MNKKIYLISSMLVIACSAQAINWSSMASAATGALATTGKVVGTAALVGGATMLATNASPYGGYGAPSPYAMQPAYPVMPQMPQAYNVNATNVQNTWGGGAIKAVTPNTNLMPPTLSPMGYGGMYGNPTGMIGSAIGAGFGNAIGGNTGAAFGSLIGAGLMGGYGSYGYPQGYSAPPPGYGAPPPGYGMTSVAASGYPSPYGYR